MEGNNINEEIAKNRDIWLKQERHLLNELIKKIENKRKVVNYNKYVKVDKLYNKAISLIEEIESGELEDDAIKKNVEEITLLFAAIKDYIKDDKEINYNPYRDNEHGSKDEEDDMER